MTIFEPPTYPQPRRPTPTQLFGRWRVALVMAAFILLAAAAGVALYFALQARTNVSILSDQNRRLDKQVSTLRGQVSDLQTKQAKDYNAVGNDLVPLTQYAQTVCSSDLTGPKGPTQYWFLCTDQKPSSQQG